MLSTLDMFAINSNGYFILNKRINYISVFSRKSNLRYFHIQAIYATARMDDFMLCKQETIAYGTHKIFGLTRSTTA